MAELVFEEQSERLWANEYLIEYPGHKNHWVPVETVTLTSSGKGLLLQGSALLSPDKSAIVELAVPCIQDFLWGNSSLGKQLKALRADNAWVETPFIMKLTGAKSCTISPFKFEGIVGEPTFVEGVEGYSFDWSGYLKAPSKIKRVK